MTYTIVKELRHIQHEWSDSDFVGDDTIAEFEDLETAKAEAIRLNTEKACVVSNGTMYESYAINIDFDDHWGYIEAYDLGFPIGRDIDCFNYTTEFDPDWTHYENCVATAQIHNYGVIFLDEDYCPVDNEYELEALYEKKTAFDNMRKETA